jgi:hypothetical protein
MSWWWIWRWRRDGLQASVTPRSAPSGQLRRRKTLELSGELARPRDGSGACAVM